MSGRCRIQLRGLPTVERVVGGADLMAVAAALDLPLSDSTLLTRHQTGTRALLRIQDGCDEHCTFCATTMARGANRSRSVEDARRVKRRVLARASCRDRDHRNSHRHVRRGHRTSLGALMTRLVAAVPGGPLSTVVDRGDGDRRRAASSCSSDGARRARAAHARAAAVGVRSRCCKRMGRHWYTAATYARGRRANGGAHAACSDSAPTSSPGFPARPRRTTRRRSRSLESLPFTYLHVFPYSLRPGTAARATAVTVSPPSIARARAAELRAIGDRKARRLRGDAWSADRPTSWSIGTGSRAARADRGLSRRSRVDPIDSAEAERGRRAAELGLSAGRRRRLLAATRARRPAFRSSMTRDAPHRLHRDLRLPDERERFRADARKARGAWL